MTNHIRKKAYTRPGQASDLLPGQQSLLTGLPNGPDPKVEAQRAVNVQARIKDLRAQLLRQVQSLDTSRHLIQHNVQIPDVAEALGLPPPVDRVTRPLKPWRLRRDSNMDIIATMLEGAGKSGVTEFEMLAHLRELGRLAHATKPLRSVHWTVAELAKRTKFATRGSRENGRRWYAYGSFENWRSAAA